MVQTSSMMVPIGSAAPDFTLQDVSSGKSVSLADFGGKKVLLVMFICRHCPFVQHVKEELSRLGRDYASKSVGIAAISSNDADNFPDDRPESLASMAKDCGFNFPFCHDPTQETAKTYRAACTPDFFLYDEKRQLVYRGQLDDSRPGNGKPANGKDLRQAIEAALSGKPPLKNQRPSMGCNIKWKSGNEPEYFK